MPIDPKLTSPTAQLTSQVYWHLILGLEKDEARSELLALTGQCHALFEEVFGESVWGPLHPRAEAVREEARAAYHAGYMAAVRAS